jgi:predicted ATPase/DNA-binding winged helix-turn-helix (wHTH) protein
MLLAEGQPVRLGGRALDLLIALTERPGETVGKRELMARVWPEVVVEEANLRVNVATLRKALGDRGTGSRYVASVPGRGYSFVAPVEYLEPRSGPNAQLPTTAVEIIGRDEACREVGALLRERRFVTLLGPGGMGKTTVALAVAGNLRAYFEDGVSFVDLASLSESGAASGALAAFLGISVYSDDPLPGILAWLRGRNALVVFDNCEHVIESAARLAETLVREAPAVSVLATSREALRVAGEWQYHLGPLESPSAGANCSAEQALTYPAVRLFVDRAQARSHSLRFVDNDVPTIVKICRRLDGIPLAIELAAANVDLLGLQGLAERLDDHLDLLTRGRRTALPRHRTLRATLDWSFDLLSPVEQTVFCRLALFAGSFDAAAALAVIADDTLTEEVVLGILGNLVEKSLMTIDGASQRVQYRLLETAREYADDKLRAGSTARSTANCLEQRHTAYVIGCFRGAEADWDRMSREDWLARYAGFLGEARTALRRSSAGNGDVSNGIRLTLLIAPVLMVLTMWDECRQWLEKALAALPEHSDAARMQLSSALGLTLLQTTGTGPELTRAWLDVHRLATRLGDDEHRLRACLGLWICRPPDGHYAHALEYAEEFRQVAANAHRRADELVGHKLVGSTQFILGRHKEADQAMATMLRDYTRRRSDSMRFQSDQIVTGRCFYGLNLWLLGYPDRASAIVAANGHEARSIGHDVAELYALIFGACPVAALNGDLRMLESSIPILSDLSSRCDRWSVWHRYYQGLVLRLRGRTSEAAVSLQATLGMLPESAYHFLLVPLLAETAGSLAAAGAPAEGLLRIDKAIMLAGRNGEGWIMPELLRIRGDILLLTGDASGATLLEQSLELAERQDARSWQLRSAMSLARYWQTMGAGDRGRALVYELLKRFTEGSATADHVAARALVSGSSDLPVTDSLSIASDIYS